jgi:transcriptional regulator CtsR
MYYWQIISLPLKGKASKFLPKVKKSNIMEGTIGQLVNQDTEGDKMSNIADLIEAYILRQLATREDGKVELRRTDIADAISCAPSQISYVLSTRFTQDKGFMVESRRGLGGYIRIVQVPMKSLVYQQMLDDIDEDTDEKTMQGMIQYLHDHDMVSTREGALLMQVVGEVFHSATMSDKERVRLLKVMLLTLENFG